jgi:hypothetical protein
MHSPSIPHIVPLFSSPDFLNPSARTVSTTSFQRTRPRSRAIQNTTSNDGSTVSSIEAPSSTITLYHAAQASTSQWKHSSANKQARTSLSQLTPCCKNNTRSLRAMRVSTSPHSHSQRHILIWCSASSPHLRRLTLPLTTTRFMGSWS